MALVAGFVFLFKNGFYSVIEAELPLEGPMFGLASYPIAFFMFALALLGLIEFTSFVKSDKLGYNKLNKVVFGSASYKEAFAIDPEVGY